MVWKNIQKELKLEGDKEMAKKTTKNKGIASFVKYGSVAAALAIVIFTSTETGRAAVDKIKEMFVPNKVVEQDIEGMKENNNVTLKESAMKYVIYIDEERYTMENANGKDKIVPKIKAAGYPEVFMEIEQIKDKKPEAVALDVEKELKAKFKTVENKGEVKDPINAKLITARTGVKAKDTVVRYYLIDNTKGGTFVVKQQYFIEAEEGHGARFYAMLKEFKIVSE
jgi:hypothetical protein